MASKKGPTQFTHWRRPRTRMYDYNYEYGVSYYKPQVNYIGDTIDPTTRSSRRRTVSPPGARTFSERWAKDPFYGIYEPISEYGMYSRRLPNALMRASSVPHLSGYEDIEYGLHDTRGRSTTRGRSVTRARSVSRERSVYRAESVSRAERSTTQARSVTRAQSLARAGSEFEYEEDQNRAGRSRSYYEYDPLSEREWEDLLKTTQKNERERSIFEMRMSLENPRELPQKKMMQTTVAHGLYKSTLYGTETWDASPTTVRFSGRQ